jgi:hypothetical protein
VDRFKSRSIRARLAPSVEAAFEAETELVIYAHEAGIAQAPSAATTGAALEEMSLWSFGLPYAEVLPDGDVLILYYAGTARTMDIRWARLHLT